MGVYDSAEIQQLNVFEYKNNNTRVSKHHTMQAVRRWYLDGVEGGNEQPSVQAAEVGDEAWRQEEQGHRNQHPTVRNVTRKHLPTRRQKTKTTRNKYPRPRDLVIETLRYPQHTNVVTAIIYIYILARP